MVGAPKDPRAVLEPTVLGGFGASAASPDAKNPGLGRVPAPKGETGGHAPIILCVDDDPSILTFLANALGSRGYAVVKADSGPRALQVLENVEPDLVLLDVMMPDMSGYDLCSRILEDPARGLVPVIFFSASGSENKARALAHGAVDYLEKPIRIAPLLDKVARHLETRRGWQGLPGSGSAGAPATATATAAASPEAATGLDGTRYTAFKRFLAQDLALAPDQVARLTALPASRLYEASSMFHLDPDLLPRAISRFLQLPFVESIQMSEVQLGVLPSSFARSHRVVAIESGSGLRFVMCNPFDWELVDTLRKSRGKTPELAIATPRVIDALFEVGQVRVPSTSVLEASSISDIEAGLAERFAAEQLAMPREDVPSEDSEPIIMLVNWIVETAHGLGASDIHIEPRETEVVVRCRVDGRLRTVRTLKPASLARPLAARIKVMSGLDITERRMPQDGRVAFRKYSKRGVDVDLRVATSPMHFGEKVVIRLLDKAGGSFKLDRLGFSDHNLRVYREKLKAPYGMILHVGPTGSGKSRTLYAALAERHSPEINIQTIEDPIEYMLTGINQMQVQSEIGLTFARGLRSYLRQDPDVILVGEIRDVETAEVAIEAALTGHLLLSTLHTNDAPSTVVRLIDMGVPPVMVSASIVVVCAQRLVRRLCDACKAPYAPGAEDLEVLGLGRDSPEVLYRPVGCPACGGIGFKGRIGVHELFAPNDEARQMMNHAGVSAGALRHHALVSCGMVPLYHDAMLKVAKGICGLEDALGTVGRPDRPFVAEAA